MKPITVSQVNEYISAKLRDDINLRGLVVEGEVSGFSRSGAHYYFTLKDSSSMIKCAIWGFNARGIDIKHVENGKMITVVADISPYAKGGSYLLSVRFVEAAGEGALMAEFNRVKKLLQEEGLFDSVYKKPLPAFPERIGIITSSTGAAVEDIKKIITSKNNCTDIMIFPTQVQGIGAVESICRNIVLANKVSAGGLHIDILIVGRGGGSAEDLAAFNDESVARAIFASEIPVISAVGHESDVSISDFVADARAETPTAAADMAVPDTFELNRTINECRKMLLASMKLKISAERNSLSSGKSLLYSNMKAKLFEARSNVEKAVITLRENEPLNILKKGYAAVSDETGILISDIGEIQEDNVYEIRLRDGRFTARVISKERIS